MKKLFAAAALAALVSAPALAGERAYSEQIGPSRAGAVVPRAANGSQPNLCLFSFSGRGGLGRMIGAGEDGMADVTDRDRTEAPPAAPGRRARPVILGTLSAGTRSIARRWASCVITFRLPAARLVRSTGAPS